jgi:hypothetical protein
MKRIGVMISKIGASNAISIGAYAFALSQIDSQNPMPEVKVSE